MVNPADDETQVALPLGVVFVVCRQRLNNREIDAKGVKRLQQHGFGFVNLALPFFGFSEPIASPKGKYQGSEGEVTIDKLWDRFEIDNITLTEFLKYFEEQGLTVTMVSSGVSLLYASFYPPKKLQERYPLRFVSSSPLDAAFTDLS